MSFSSHEDNESTNKKTLLHGQNGAIRPQVTAGDTNHNDARPTISEIKDQFYASNYDFNENDEDEEDGEEDDDEIASEEIAPKEIK